MEEHEKLQVRMMAEQYDRQSSEFYDYHVKRGDVDFYVSLAKEYGGPVLEIGCGTGRVLIPTARENINITGLDNSADMLRLCCSKLDCEPSEVRDKVELVQADMRDFDLESEYSLITVPFGPFNYLISVEEQMSCLKCIRRHLKDEGALVMDLFYPNSSEFSSSEKGFTATAPFIMPDGRSITWGIHFSAVDFNHQIIHEELFYNVVYADGRKEKLVYPSLIRYFYPYEVEHLLAMAGFKTEHVYADFTKEPFGTRYPSELIFMAKKSPH